MPQRATSVHPSGGLGPLCRFPGGPACLQVMAHSGEAFCRPPVRGGRSRPPRVPVGAPVPAWVIHAARSVYLSHSLTPTGASASQQIPPGPVSLPDLGITGPELAWSLPPRGLPGHPAESCPLASGMPSARGAEQGAVLSVRASRWSRGPAAGPVCPAPLPEQTEVGLLPPSLDFGSQCFQSLLCFSIFCSAS